MKNKLIDLNNHLFAQLERLGDENLKGEELADEINRAMMVCKVSESIIAAGNLVVRAYEAVDGSMGKLELPLMLEGTAVRTTSHPSQNPTPFRKIGVYGEHISNGKAGNA
jgi:hypothetical protein